MYKKTGLTIIFLSGLLIPLLSQGYGVMDFVQSKFSEMEGYRESLLKDKSPENRNKVIQLARESVMNILEFDVISQMVLGKYYDQKSKEGKEQIQEFENLYRQIMTEQILTVNLPDDKTLEKKNPLKIKRESAKKDHIFKKNAYIVYCTMTKKKIDYNIDLYFYKKENQFFLYDVRIDDSSTLLDYRNYFYRTIQQKGMEQLILILKKKVKQLENGKIHNQ